MADKEEVLQESGVWPERVRKKRCWGHDPQRNYACFYIHLFFSAQAGYW